jgi:hypothetical protein
MRDCGRERLDRCADGFARNGKVTDLTCGDAFAFAALHSGNAVHRLSFVIPRECGEGPSALPVIMDARVKPAHDAEYVACKKINGLMPLE